MLDGQAVINNTKCVCEIMSYSYELLNYHALSLYHVDLLYVLVPSGIPRLAYHISSRHPWIQSLAGGILVTVAYVLILALPLILDVTPSGK